jgi:hypothetical protein
VENFIYRKFIYEKFMRRIEWEIFFGITEKVEKKRLVWKFVCLLPHLFINSQTHSIGR